jgi:quinol monooxygenase YgiN
MSALLLSPVISSPSISRAAEQAQEHPIVAQVKAAVSDLAKPFTLIVRLTIKDGAAEKFQAAFAKAAKATRQEKGNRAYDLNRDAKTPTRYLLYERWQNLAALQTHLKSAHITTLFAELGDLLAMPPEATVFVPAGD